MTYDWIIFTAVTVAALVVLGWVLAYGFRWRRRLRRFAERRGGAYSDYDEFGLTARLSAFRLADEMLPGRAARLPKDDGDAYLFELAGPNRTLTAYSRPSPGSDFELRTRFPPPDEGDFADFFELEPPDALEELARKSLVEAARHHRWILSAERRDERLLVRTEKGRLPPEDWGAFVDLADSL